MKKSFAELEYEREKSLLVTPNEQKECSEEFTKACESFKAVVQAVNSCGMTINEAREAFLGLAAIK